MHQCVNCKGTKMEEYTLTIRGWMCHSCVRALSSLGLIRK